jgi:dUTPase
MINNEFLGPKVGVYKISEDAIIPFKGTELSACYDICACLHVPYIKFHGRAEDINVADFGTPDAYIRMYPDDLALIPTGLIFCLPRTHHLKFYSRSGNVWKRFLSVANQPAVIDSDYTYESFILLHNRSQYPQIIKTGTAIAQCEICINNNIDFVDVDINYLDKFKYDINMESSRDGGIGSTDKK